MKHYVYLAGPIAGLTYKGATDWRDLMASDLDSDKIETLSPLRGKDYLADKGELGTSAFPEHALSTTKAINRRDRFDCTRASAVVVNLLGATKISVGSVMEIAWAFQANIPVIVVSEKDNVHNHMMLDDCTTYRVETLREAAQIVKFLFNDKKK